MLATMYSKFIFMVSTKHSPKKIRILKPTFPLFHPPSLLPSKITAQEDYYVLLLTLSFKVPSFNPSLQTQHGPSSPNTTPHPIQTTNQDS